MRKKREKRRKRKKEKRDVEGEEEDEKEEEEEDEKEEEEEHEGEAEDIKEEKIDIRNLTQPNSKQQHAPAFNRITTNHNRPHAHRALLCPTRKQKRRGMRASHCQPRVLLCRPGRLHPNSWQTHQLPPSQLSIFYPRAITRCLV